MLLIERLYGRNFLKSIISLQISKSCINYTVVVSWCPYAISWKMDPCLLQYYLAYNGRFKAMLKISWPCCNTPPLPASSVMWFLLQLELLYHNNSVPSLPDIISKCSLCSLFPSSLLVFHENLSFWWLPLQLFSFSSFPASLFLDSVALVLLKSWAWLPEVCKPEMCVKLKGTSVPWQFPNLHCQEKMSFFRFSCSLGQVQGRAEAVPALNRALV